MGELLDLFGSMPTKGSLFPSCLLVKRRRRKRRGSRMRKADEGRPIHSSTSMLLTSDGPCVSLGFLGFLGFHLGKIHSSASILLISDGPCVSQLIQTNFFDFRLCLCYQPLVIIVHADQVDFPNWRGIERLVMPVFSSPPRFMNIQWDWEVGAVGRTKQDLDQKGDFSQCRAQIYESTQLWRKVAEQSVRFGCYQDYALTLVLVLSVSIIALIINTCRNEISTPIRASEALPL